MIVNESLITIIINDFSHEDDNVNWFDEQEVHPVQKGDQGQSDTKSGERSVHKISKLLDIFEFQHLDLYHVGWWTIYWIVSSCFHQCGQGVVSY